MAGLTRFAAAALAVVIAAPASAGTLDRWNAHIEEASRRFALPREWIGRVIDAESRGQPDVTSRAGAMGLMQLMPRTWAEMRAVHRLGADPYDPRDNILAGSAYLRAMYDRFGYEGMFAAYNAGPARYARHLIAGASLPRETVLYVEKVGRSGPRNPQASAPSFSRRAEGGWHAGELFFVRNGASPEGEERRDAPGLFVIGPDARQPTS